MTRSEAAVCSGCLTTWDGDTAVPMSCAALSTSCLLYTSLLTKVVRQPEHTAASLRVIADHSRAVTFLISDGVLPSNEGRGYVLRKIIRRAILHGRKGYAEGPFLHQMVYSVVDLMKDAYPELVDAADRVARVVKEEETRFARTLDVGLETVSYTHLDVYKRQVRLLGISRLFVPTVETRWLGLQ